MLVPLLRTKNGVALPMHWTIWMKASKKTRKHENPCGIPSPKRQKISIVHHSIFSWESNPQPPNFWVQKGAHPKKSAKRDVPLQSLPLF